MNFIAAHWDEIGMIAFMALLGVVLVVRGVREYQQLRQVQKEIAENNRRMLDQARALHRREYLNRSGGPSAP